MDIPLQVEFWPKKLEFRTQFLALILAQDAIVAMQFDVNFSSSVSDGMSVNKNQKCETVFAISIHFNSCLIH